MRTLLKPCASRWSSSASLMGGLPQEVSSGMASNVLPMFVPGCIAATIAIGLAGCGEVDGDVDGEADADSEGEGNGVAGLPVQVTPLSAKEAGAVLLPAHDPLKPNGTLPLVGMTAL